MINKVFKYAVRETDFQTVNLPVGSKILKIGNQNGSMQLWAMVNSREPNKLPLELAIVGTGNVTEISFENYVHYDTIILGAFVWHIYANRKQLAEFQ